MYYSAVILARVCVFTRARVGRASAFPEFRVPRVSRARPRARLMSPSVVARRVVLVARRAAPMTRTRDPATTRASASRRIAGVRELATTHDVFLLDQFGVLHDGREAYADAVTCVRELKRLGKEVYVLSNSSRRRDGTIARLEEMGFDGDAFAGATTSGETTARFLEREASSSSTTSREIGKGECFDRLRNIIREARVGGRKPAFAHATWDARGAVALGETVSEAYEIIPPPFTATTMDAVDFVLAHGMEAFGRGDGAAPTPASVEDLRALARAAAARKIPLCVANPDVETVSGSELIAMPGALAMWYAEAFEETHPGEDASGYVCEMGKPDAVAYDALLGEFGVDAGGKIVAVGDSLAHDIAGGERAGLDTVFVCGTGIHVDDVRRAKESEDEGEALRRLYAARGATPTYVVEKLRW